MPGKRVMMLVASILLANSCLASASRAVMLSTAWQKEPSNHGSQGGLDELAQFAEQVLSMDEPARSVLLDANAGIVDVKQYTRDDKQQGHVFVFTYIQQQDRYYTYVCMPVKGATQQHRCKAADWPWVYNEDRITFNHKPLYLMKSTERAAAY